MILGLIAFLGACEEQLEVIPKNAITPEQALNDISGYEGLVFSAYRSMHGFGYYGQSQILDAEALSDNLVIANNTGRYTGEVVNAIGAHVNIWGIYGIINTVNIVIEGVPELEETGDLADRILGEALALRGLLYHDLAKAYGYEPGQEVDGFDLSVILRTTPTLDASDADFRARATNTEVYEQIEEDLLRAIDLLPEETDASIFPRRLSKTAAKALLSRVYLYWGRWDDSANYADQVINETSIQLLDSADYLAAWAEEPHGESIFELDISAVDWSTVDGVNNSLNSVTAQHDADYEETNGQFAVGGSPDLVESISPEDVRSQLWVFFSDNWENLKWRGELGDYRENIPLIRISEVYLTSAEAHARAGNEDTALDRLNTLLEVRGLDEITLTGDDLTDRILDERRIELAFEGHRYFDLKRLGLDIPKPQTSFGELQYSDFRIIARLPVGEVILNELLVQNPGY